MSTDPRIEAAAKEISVQNGWPSNSFPNGMADRTARLYRQHAERVVAAADKAATITTVEGLDALPVGSVAIGWSFDGGTPYLRCLSMRGQLVWGCVGQADLFKSADLLTEGFTARVIHWGQS